MPEIEVVQETALTLAELKDKLEGVQKRDKELTFRGKKNKEYIDIFLKYNSKQTEEVKKKLKDLEISRLKDKHVAKIIDLGAKDIEGLRVVLSGENLTLKQEDLQRILECLK